MRPPLFSAVTLLIVNLVLIPPLGAQTAPQFTAAKLLLNQPSFFPTDGLFGVGDDGVNLFCVSGAVLICLHLTAGQRQNCRRNQSLHHSGRGEARTPTAV